MTHSDIGELFKGESPSGTPVGHVFYTIHELPDMRGTNISRPTHAMVKIRGSVRTLDGSPLNIEIRENYVLVMKDGKMLQCQLDPDGTIHNRSGIIPSST